MMSARLLFDAPIGTKIPWPFLAGNDAEMAGGLPPSPLLCCVLVSGDGVDRYECEFDVQGVGVAKMVFRCGSWRLLCVSREGELR